MHRWSFFFCFIGLWHSLIACDSRHWTETSQQCKNRSIPPTAPVLTAAGSPTLPLTRGGGGDGAGGRKCFRQLPAITVPRASPAPAVCLQTRCRKCSAAARQLQSLAAGQGRRLAAHTSEDTRLRSPKLAQGPCSDGTGLRSLQKFTKTE